MGGRRDERYRHADLKGARAVPNFYSIYFTRNGEVVRLPHNPEKLPETRSASNGEYNVLGLGPVMVPRTPNLKELTVSGYFPGTLSSSLTSLLTYRPPEYYINFFTSAMNDREPILYTPVRINELGIPFSLSDPGYYVLVTDFKTEERGGETGDFYYDLTLKEWRDYAPNRVQIVQDATAQASTAATASAASRLSTRARIARAASAAADLAVAQAAAVAAPLSASKEPTRQIPPNRIVVGSLCRLDGAYWAGPEAQAPETPASGLSVSVVRIVDSANQARAYVKGTDGTPLGWCSLDALQVVNNAANY